MQKVEPRAAGLKPTNIGYVDRVNKKTVVETLTAQMAFGMKDYTFGTVDSDLISSRVKLMILKLLSTACLLEVYQ